VLYSLLEASVQAKHDAADESPGCKSLRVSMQEMRKRNALNGMLEYMPQKLTLLMIAVRMMNQDIREMLLRRQKRRKAWR